MIFSEPIPVIVSERGKLREGRLAFAVPPAASEELVVEVKGTPEETMVVTIELKEPKRPGNVVYVNEPVTFCGYVKYRDGTPVEGACVTVAEKDWLGRWVPIKDSAGREIHAETDSRGYWELRDDDGWPTAGTKKVWALACPPGMIFDSYWQGCVRR